MIVNLDLLHDFHCLMQNSADFFAYYTVYCIMCIYTLVCDHVLVLDWDPRGLTAGGSTTFFFRVVHHLLDVQLNQPSWGLVVLFGAVS